MDEDVPDSKEEILVGKGEGMTELKPRRNRVSWSCIKYLISFSVNSNIVEVAWGGMVWHGVA